ncbi:hypothetical protein RB2399 [Rhodopirellula baltica SH 1]|uniref:Uncharacterized protein n=1 Tax=Rhodopirellula baltica (strain DSM 10527 / NCIMB 13988 / SH1) TaxID=243090 RepID=Q7UVW4_RHOBA|nr:hypothetical protein RB2399 [Rhodopirellula baltica SH 1]
MGDLLAHGRKWQHGRLAGNTGGNELISGTLLTSRALLSTNSPRLPSATFLGC